MKYSCCVIVPVLFALCLAVLSPAATQAETKAEGFIRINYDPEASGDEGLLLRMVRSLLHSERLQLEAMSEVSGLSVDEIKAIAKENKDDLPGIGYRAGGGGGGAFGGIGQASLLPGHNVQPELTSTGWMAMTSTQSNDERIPADQFVAEFCKLVERELEGVHRASFEEMNEEIGVTEGEIVQAKNELDKLSRSRRNIGIEFGTSQEHLHDQLHRLLGEQQQVAVDRHALEARRKALVERIAQLEDEIRNEVDADPVTAELEQLVAARRRALDAVRRARGAAEEQGKPLGPISDLKEKEEGYASARLQFEKYRREAARTVGGDRLHELNAMLTQTIVDLAEAEARFEFLGSELIPKARDAISAAQRLDELTFEIEMTRQSLADATQRRAALLRERHSRRSPKVTFLPT